MIAAGLVLSSLAPCTEAAIPGRAVLEFQQPTNHSVFSNTDEIPVFDRRLYAQVRGDGSVALVIPGGALVFGGYDLEVSEDLIAWTRVGSFEPGNVAAFYLDVPPPGTSRRFYRSVYLPPVAPAF